jgi:hypothetical protein
MFKEDECWKYLMEISVLPNASSLLALITGASD